MLVRMPNTLPLLDAAIKELETAEVGGMYGTRWCHDSHRVDALKLLHQLRSELTGHPESQELHAPQNP